MVPQGTIMLKFDDSHNLLDIESPAQSLYISKVREGTLLPPAISYVQTKDSEEVETDKESEEPFSQFAVCKGTH